MYEMKYLLIVCMLLVIIMWTLDKPMASLSAAFCGVPWMGYCPNGAYDITRVNSNQSQIEAVTITNAEQLFNKVSCRGNPL